MDRKTFDTEKKHLNKTIEKIKSANKQLASAMESLGATNLEQLKDLRNDPVTSGTDFLMFVQQLHEKNESFNVKDKVKRMEELDYLSKEPFFARIDLKDTKSDKSQDSLYIGKFGYTEKDPVITDWRAKIASIYYRYRYPQKDVHYTAPEGTITKDLTLKRTFEIDRGELIKFYNNDIQLDEDQIIAGKIEGRTGGVLEDIIETIQESQLDIIESDPRKVCIVQGCVGSGKSTVAIHKLSHIFFNYPDLIKPERSILIAKNGVLVRYLATLFPKLGIFDINYKTLKDLIINIIFREKLGIHVDFENDGIFGFDVAKVKALEKRLNDVHGEYKNKIDTLLKHEDFESFSGFVYVNDVSVCENIDEFLADLKEELDYQKEKYKDNPKSSRAWIYSENIKNLRSLTKKLQQLKTRVRETTFKSLLKHYKIDKSRKLSYLETLIYLYIYEELYGFCNTPKYQYCVVDEGQDFSVLEYLVLGKLVQNGRFCILGDLNQSYLEEGLSKWELIRDVIKKAKEAETFELDTNYRSTHQIINFANKILSKHTKKYLPKSIKRAGKEVEVFRLPRINDVLEHFEASLRIDFEDINKSIGIICFDENLFDPITKIITGLKEKMKISAEKIIILREDTRVSYIPKGIYLTKFENCKGLEFSKVYVLGANIDNINNFSDAKKAFVAVTRAMNELVVYSRVN